MRMDGVKKKQIQTVNSELINHEESYKNYVNKLESKIIINNNVI